MRFTRTNRTEPTYHLEGLNVIIWLRDGRYKIWDQDKLEWLAEYASLNEAKRHLSTLLIETQLLTTLTTVRKVSIESGAHRNGADNKAD